MTFPADEIRIALKAQQLENGDFDVPFEVKDIFTKLKFRWKTKTSDQVLGKTIVYGKMRPLEVECQNPLHIDVKREPLSLQFATTVQCKYDPLKMHNKYNAFSQRVGCDIGIF